MTTRRWAMFWIGCVACGSHTRLDPGHGHDGGGGGDPIDGNPPPSQGDVGVTGDTAVDQVGDGPGGGPIDIPDPELEQLGLQPA